MKNFSSAVENTPAALNRGLRGTEILSCHFLRLTKKFFRPAVENDPTALNRKVREDRNPFLEMSNALVLIKIVTQIISRGRVFLP